jgi:hypothetical protein
MAAGDHQAFPNQLQTPCSMLLLPIGVRKQHAFCLWARPVRVMPGTSLATPSNPANMSCNCNSDSNSTQTPDTNPSSSGSSIRASAFPIRLPRLSTAGRPSYWHCLFRFPGLGNRLVVCACACACGQRGRSAKSVIERVVIALGLSRNGLTRLLTRQALRRPGSNGKNETAGKIASSKVGDESTPSGHPDQNTHKVSSRGIWQ